jgi:hypothetical protein
MRATGIDVRVMPAVAAALVAVGVFGLADGPPARPLPAPRSQTFTGLRWTAAPTRYPGTASDMHWWTWAADGSVYLVDDDGKNFGGPWSFSHFLKVTGTPPDHKVESLSRFDGLGLKDGVAPGKDYTARVRERGFSRYVGGPVAVGNRVYATVYDYDWSAKDINEGVLDSFSAHGGVVGLLYTDDEGKTWRNAPPKDGRKYFLGPRFAALQFLNFGPGYTGVPDHLAGYVYAVSNDDNWESGNHVYLARAAKDKLLDRSAWEFFAGFRPGDGADRPAWTGREDEARPILSDPGHCGHASITWNPAAGRYLLLVFSDVVPHKRDADPKAGPLGWDRQTELQVYDGPQPWGPWGLVHDERPWDGPDHTPYLPHVPTPWLSRDGGSGWLLFSGDYARKGNEWYGLMVQPFRLTK